MDVNALFLASLYGVFMGSYPVPIKTRTVLAANVHPIIFQSFKSTWVFVTGLFFLIPIALRGESFHFSWWGVASAAAWVPSGFGTISAVPRIGVSLTIVLSCSWSSVLNFLVFWLVIGEEMKTHTIGGRQIFLAPIYLGAIVLGMAGLVYGPRLLCADPKRNPKLVVEATNASAAATSLGGSAEALLLNHAADAEADAATTPTPLPPRSSSLRDKLIGLFFAIWAGTLAAVQYAIVSLGKQAALAEHGCFDPSRTSSAAAPPPQPPPRPSRALLPTLSPPTLPPLAPPPPSDACSIVVQSFDTAGSWMVSFGLGALLVTYSAVAVFYALSRWKPRLWQTPRPQLRVMLVPGSLAGLSWAIANFCGTAAAMIESNASGGDAVVMTQMMCTQLIVSGLWGILYYHELRGAQAVVWCAFALWTLGFMALLGGEKAK